MTMFRFLMAKSNNFALFGGGDTGSPTTLVDRIYFANGTRTTASALQVARLDVSCLSTTNIGYFVGGQNASFVFQSSIDRYLFSTNSTNTSGGSLSSARVGVACHANATIGVMTGGNPGNTTSLTTRELYTFATDGVSSGLSLTTGIGAASSFGDSSVAITAMGLPFGGGQITSGTKYTIATNTSAASSAFVVGRYWTSAVACVPFGLVAGGIYSVRYNNVDKYVFSTDIVSSTTTLSAVRNSTAAAGDSQRAFFSGGDSAGRVSTNDAYHFSNETKYTGTTLSSARWGLGGCSSAPGYL